MIEALLMPSMRANPTGPLGPEQLIAGDSSLGYFGTFVDDRLTGDLINAACDVTEGVSINSDTPWVKHVHNGKILISALKPIRHSVTWRHLYEKGLVYGLDGFGTSPPGVNVLQNKTIVVDGDVYRIRLFKGADADPCPTTQYNVNHPMGTRNSEYSHLYLRLLGAGLGDWEQLSNEDVGYLVSNRQSMIICQERHPYGSSYRVFRGYGGPLGLASGSYTYTAYSPYVTCWKPVLELVP